MSAASSYQNTKAEEYARWRRRDHANIEALQNLVIARISEESGVEMPPNVRHLISALQGAHGGGEVAYEPFTRDYLTIGEQLQFTGTEEAIRARVRRWVDDLLRWQRETSVELFSIVKGGEIIGQRDDGTPIRKATVVIDNLKPKTDDAVQRARSSELWKGNTQKDIKPHPGKALAAQVEWLKKELPKIKPEPEGDGSGEKKTPAKMPAGEYAQKQEEQLVKSIEDAADGIEQRDGDAGLWLEKMEKQIRKMRESRHRTEGARRSWIMPDDESDASHSGRSAYTCNKFEGSKGAVEDALDQSRLCNKNVTQAGAQTLDNDELTEAENPENASEALPFALNMAEQGIAVFPVYGCTDGICHCPVGSECRSAGKHPIPTLTPRGVKNATTDTAQIRRWFAKEPHANLAWAMGGPLRLIGVDVDPRAGGDASLCDLVEAHGDEWLDTFTVRTGSLGNHFVYRLPEGVEPHRGKLAPGIDLKSEGGYLVAPPSVHAMGRRYEVEKNVYIALAPEWMVEELMRKADEPERVPVDFQAYRERKATGGGPVIAEGERNDRLFRVGCALWGKGEVGSRAELLQRLMETNVERVSPPLDSDEVYKIVDSISNRYVLGVPIKEGAA
jgi:hypothetical protein